MIVYSGDGDEEEYISHNLINPGISTDKCKVEANCSENAVDEGVIRNNIDHLLIEATE